MEDMQSQTENRNSWVFGFTPQAEIWNGRLAMVGFFAAILTTVLQWKDDLFQSPSFDWRDMLFNLCPATGQYTV